MDRKFLFLLGSGRKGGNTETLTRAAAAQLPPEVTQNWVRLSDVQLPPFQDGRHEGTAVAEYVEHEEFLLDATLDATDIVIASPTYWYTVSPSTKLYLDYWSGWLHAPGADFRTRMKGKKLWAVSVLAEEPEQADALIDTLRRCADYLRMDFGSVLLGNGSKPDDVLTDFPAMTNAKTFLAA